MFSWMFGFICSVLVKKIMCNVLVKIIFNVINVEDYVRSFVNEK